MGSRSNAARPAILSICFTIAAPGLIILAGFIIYSNTFFTPFHFDGESFIVLNPAIRNIWNLHDIWNFWPTRFFTYLSIAFNYHFSRFDVLGYHLFNTVIHVGSALLVRWLALLTFSTPVMKEQKISRNARLISFLAGAIFVAHPIQIQAVTYIYQRAASLATFFYLASLVFYVKSRLLLEYKEAALSPRRFYYCVSFISALLAMFTKEMTITLPLMVIFYEFNFFGPIKIRNVRYFIPFLVTLLVIPMTMFLTKLINISANTGEIWYTFQAPPEISPSHYLLTQFRVIVTYIRLVFLPINQNLDYDYPIANTLFNIPVLASLFLLIGIMIVAIRLFRNHRMISFGIFWFLFTLVPESSIAGADVIFENRLYLPMVGCSFFLAGVLFDISKKERIKSIIIILSMLLVFYSILTYQRNKVWKDNFTLWNDTARKSPNKARPNNNLGQLYLDRGDLDRALAGFNKAIEIDPNYPDAYNNIGNVYLKKGELDRAISEYDKALKIDPAYVNAYNNRGTVYQDKGDIEQAISDFNKAIELNPNYARAYNNLAILYFHLGRQEDAIALFKKAIEKDPGYTDAYANLDRAIQLYKKER